MASLEELFDRGTGGNCHKWRHYFEIYDRFCRKFVGANCTYLEIGVQKGGSLQIMQEWLGDKARIVGIDIDPACAALRDQGREVYIGDQSDIAFLNTISTDCGPFDIIVDDGSHIGDHQIVSFLRLFPHLKDGGVYLVEDLQTIFRPDLQQSGFGINFYDFAKGLVEKLTLYHLNFQLDDRYHQPREERPGRVNVGNFATTDIFGIYFFESMIVIEKRKREEPLCQVK